MNKLRPPRFETRRRAELRDELIARARAWLPGWRPRDAVMDFGGALFDIAARLESEVAQRLDKVPEKTQRDFLQWLGVRGKAGRAGRMPVVFGLAAGSEAALVPAGVQMQVTPAAASAVDAPTPVTFETEQPLMLVPGRLASVVGADPAYDRFFLQPQGFSGLEPPTPGPSVWSVKASAPLNAVQAQFEPALGLDALPTLLHERTKLSYRITAADGGLVTLEPPIGTPDAALLADPAQDPAFRTSDRLSALPSFSPFGGAERNRQQHAVYIGSESLLNLPASARITISGLAGAGITWSYWGKAGSAGPVGWQVVSPSPDATELTLDKPAGSVEITTIGGKSSRWLRGIVDPGRPATLPAARISLLVNCRVADDAPKPAVAVEGIANTAPLVLDAAFFPLGRDPRLFDAFYIGCPEAFSKKNAFVTITLRAFDGITQAMTAGRIGTDVIALFAVGDDGNLLRLRQVNDTAMPVKRLIPVRPPLNDAGVLSVNVPPAFLNRFQPPRLTVVSRPNSIDVLVAATAGANAWLWSENSQAAQNRWFNLGVIADPELPAAAPDEKDPPSVLILVDGVNIRAVALRSKVLYETVLKPGWDRPEAATPQWKAVPMPTSTVARDWKAIAPVYDEATRMTGASFANGWIALDSTGIALFLPRGGGSEFKKNLVKDVTSALFPLVVRIDTKSMLVVAEATPGEVSAWVVADADTTPPKKPVAAVRAPVLGHTLDWAPVSPDGIAIVFSQSLKDAGGQFAAWYPLAPEVKDNSVLYLSAKSPVLNGAPALTTDLVVAPGIRGEVIAAQFHAADFTRTNIPTDTLASALVFRHTLQPPVAHDFLQTKIKGSASVIDQIEEPKTDGTRVWLRIPNSDKAAFVTSAKAFRRLHKTPFDGSLKSSSDTESKINADPADEIVAQDTQIVVRLDTTEKLSLHTVTKVSEMRKIITVQPPIDADKDTGLHYTAVRELLDSDVLPLLLLPPGGPLPVERLTALQEGGAYFRGAVPSPNDVLFLQARDTNSFEAAVFAQTWEPDKTPSSSSGRFALVTAAIFGQAVTLANTPTANPALSWEYFDGQAWWTIKKLLDGTANLSTTGDVTFCVPPELQPTDVAGRKSHWIRARLVGGDYGQETVIVKTTPAPNPPGGNIQTFDRSRTGTVPQFASIRLRYSVCCASLPDFLITLDGGGTRDQTAANTIDDANVELFTPLSEDIRRAASVEPGAAAETDRAVYLGFDAPLMGGPLGVLFLLEEGSHSAAYPLRVDVLRETGFETILAQDETRGLNESGVLTFNLSAKPPLVALFGSESRYWLRLRPGPRLKDVATWQPKIRAAYLNASFARASETQGLERLGSSDGSPRQRVLLARPPVLEGTLELRVREPLGDEEIEVLQKESPGNVLDELSNGDPGPWVLWQRVGDPDDAGKGERAYALNHETGEISFGDGLHGRIPPIGTDAIVAVRYKRGGGEAANRVLAWSQINLTSPVQGVERVLVPDGAAGGSDPQTAVEVLRFAPANQFMRERALTLRDYEMLALQSSRDIAQARALPRGTGVQLVVAMRGQDPQPNEAQRREIVKYLIERSSPVMAAEGAVTIARLRPIEARIRLELTILSIEDSGSVARDARQRVFDLLDPARGGLDGEGWPLGELPTDTDIAAALDGLDHLEEVDDVQISFSAGGLTVTALQPSDLVVLESEGVAIEFAVLSAEVQP